MKLLVIAIFFVGLVFCEEEAKAFEDDSYLEALKTSRSESEKSKSEGGKLKKNIRREYDVNSYYPEPHYGQPLGPVPNYGPPVPQYGPPIPNPPPNPVPMYGPPANYGPPPTSLQVFYGAPHALESFWEKLKFKLSLFTLGKILLKLVIFKKIVSWIAVLCLLLFIPSLKNKDETNTNDERKFAGKNAKGNDQIDSVAEFVLKALETFSHDAPKSS